MEVLVVHASQCVGKGIVDTIGVMKLVFKCRKGFSSARDIEHFEPKGTSPVEPLLLSIHRFLKLSIYYHYPYLYPYARQRSVRIIDPSCTCSLMIGRSSRAVRLLFIYLVSFKHPVNTLRQLGVQHKSPGVGDSPEPNFSKLSEF